MTTATHTLQRDIAGIDVRRCGPRVRSPQAATSKRVLMICAAFPPTGGPGVQRISKFAKYLPEFGWRPVVWTTRHLPPLPTDESLAHDVPDGCDVRRFGMPTSCTGDTTGHWRWRLARRTFARMMIPDYLLPWAMRSYPRLIKTLGDESFDAIFSTYSPPSCHLLAWRLKRATGLPWVADFRDLWTDDYAYDAPSWRRPIDRRMENAFLRSADRVIAVSDAQRDILAKHDPKNSHKFMTVTNGVDLDDFGDFDRACVRRALHGPQDRFVLVFCGWFLSDRIPDSFMPAVARFSKQCKGRGRRLELRIIGSIADNLKHQMARCGVHVHATGYLPHDAAIRHMVAADALLAMVPFAGNGDSLIPGKCFEYIAAGRPILLIGPADGQAAQLICRHKAGIVAGADEGDIINALGQLISQPIFGESWRMSEVGMHQISRQVLTERLANVLDQLAGAYSTEVI